MVTGSSKIWVGVDNTPIELKKSNDSSLELNEWECLCSADALNVGDYCFGAPLISVNLTGLIGYQPSASEFYQTDNYILVAHRHNTGYWYSAIIPKSNPVQEYSDYKTLTLANSSNVTNTSIEVKSGDAFKFTYTYRNTQYVRYYDISSGDYITITESDYNSRDNSSVYPTLEKYQTVYYSTGSGNDYQNIQCWISSIADIQTVVTFSGDGKYINSGVYYSYLALTDNNLIVSQIGVSAGVFILDYAYKKSDNMFKAGPKQVMPVTYEVNDNNFQYITVTTAYNSTVTNPVMHGVVTTKIDSTHVVVAI